MLVQHGLPPGILPGFRNLSTHMQVPGQAQILARLI